MYVEFLGLQQKASLGLNYGQPICILIHNACGRAVNTHWTDAVGRVY